MVGASNLGVRCRSRWDFIMIERVDNSPYGNFMFSEIQRCQYDYLICKNNYLYHPIESVNKLNRLSRLKRVFILEEYQADPSSFLEALPRVFDQSTDFLFPQHVSSVATMLLFVIRQGASDIVIHGADVLYAALRGNQPPRGKLLINDFENLFHRLLQRLILSGVHVSFAQEYLAE